MRRSPLRNLTLWLTILTILWSSQCYSYVWCMTAQGTTHLESTLEPHCDHVPPSLNAGCAAIAAFSTADSCGPCLDLAAAQDTLQQRKPTAYSLYTPLPPANALPPKWAPPTFIRQLSSKLILSSPPRVATALLTHRTIVLLI